MGARVVSTGYGHAALDALRDVVAGAKAEDAMAPVTILVPNNIAGIVARRHLAHGLTDDHPGVAGIYLATLPRLAEQIAAHTLAPRKPATSAIVSSAWRSVLDAHTSVFDPVKEHPATIRALVKAHRELRDLSEDALDRVATSSKLSADLVRLQSAVTASLQLDWYDATDLLDAASGRIEIDVTASGELGHVALYLPQALSLAESRFGRVLADSVELTAVVGLTGVDRADRVVRRSLTRMGLPDDAAKPKPGVASEVMHASDSDDEIRRVVRDVVVTLDDTPAHRVAVLYGGTNPYARLVHEHLGAAGITINGSGTRPVNERAIGRGFLGILQLAADDVPRADLFTAVSETPTRDFAGSRVPASRWERLSRSAAVVVGEDWHDRLGTYAAGLQAAIDNELQREDPWQSRLDAYERDVAGATALRTFATTLRERLTHGLTLTRWSTLSTWALDLFTDLNGDDRQLAQLPQEEQYAAVTVQATLGGLAGLDEFEPTAHLARLIEVLSLELETALARVGRFGDGVLVAPLSAAVGLDVDVVYVVGLAEDTYPGRLHEDALLLERVRDRSDGELASYRDTLDAKHRHLLAAFCAAPRVVASFPRGDLRRSTRRLPSRFLLPTLRDLSGNRQLAATEWESAESPRINGAASYAEGIKTAPMPVSEQEWRTRVAASGQRLDDEPVDAAVEMVAARASDSLTRYDGNLAGVDGLPDFADGRRMVAPTTLEAYAVCPHAYFVRRLLRVEPVESPEEIIKISPLDIGNLIHATMDEFITESEGSLPDYGQPWTAEQRARLREIAIVKAAEFEEHGSTGHRRLWQTERDRIIADLDWMLTEDDRWRADGDARVIGSELSFGMDGTEPVKVQVADGTVLMRGSADKVDEARDGTIIVTDIKTGGTFDYKALKTDPVAAGTKLQLPAYAQAARQILGHERAEASYWFIRHGKRDRISVELTDEVEQTYADTVGTLVASIAGGLFPAKAPEQPDFSRVKCLYCNPDGIGHGEARERYLKKRHDPALRDLVTLIDPGAVESVSAESVPGGEA
ncbi:MAG: PD-(D/E)XK nuclease family protein [Nocardioidaceae bacterium]|nr:PD-(D/E)XK nuclease family protein [Nocardioidaceae bacterium]